jgi:hypothetical protein
LLAATFILVFYIVIFLSRPFVFFFLFFFLLLPLFCFALAIFIFIYIYIYLKKVNKKKQRGSIRRRWGRGINKILDSPLSWVLPPIYIYIYIGGAHRIVIIIIRKKVETKVNLRYPLYFFYKCLCFAKQKQRL